MGPGDRPEDLGEQLKTRAIRLGIAGALAALWLAGLAVPAQAVTTDPCGPPVDSVKFCKADNGSVYPVLVDSAAVTGPWPGISGALQVGSTLTVIDGTWGPRDATWGPRDATLTHQWLRNDEPVPGATGFTYLLTESDLGKSIRVKTTGRAPGYETTTGQSRITALVTNAGGAVPSFLPGYVSFESASIYLHRPSRLVIATPGNFRGAAGMYFQYQWLRDGAPIEGATGKMFDTTGWGSKGLLSVRVTGHAAGFSPVIATSTQRDVSSYNQTPGAVVTGGTGLGDVLTGVDDVPWAFDDREHEYRWLRDGIVIPGATGLTYTITAEDQGHTLVLESGVSGFFSGHACSNRVAVPAAAAADVELKQLTTITKPVVTGTFVIGSAMKVTSGTWSEPVEKLTFTYDWLSKDGVWGSGRTFTPRAAAHVGETATVVVTASAPGYAPARVRVTAPKPIYGNSPSLLGLPAVYGTATVKVKLTAETGSWSYRDQEVKRAVQWLRDDVPIPGATGLEYTLVGGDFGKKISIKVTPSLDGRILKAQKSSPTATVAAAALSSATPTIAGTVQAGNVLTVKRGAWTWGTAFTYRWLRNGVPISGATESTYKVRTADKGTKLTVRVTGSRLGYTTVTQTSGPYLAR